jgi:hypothetical protein
MGDARRASREWGSAGELHVLPHSGSTHDDAMQARGRRAAFAALGSDADGRCHAGKLRGRIAGKLRSFRVSRATHDDDVEARGERRVFVASKSDPSRRCLAGKLRDGFVQEIC